ncbi:MAG TPA: hypothetical protein VLF68_00885 [Candidatus Saccharimonadales bacterium]|nr:hypothetical protein [Candidatus Saccharimonadales bacterium]
MAQTRETSVNIDSAITEHRRINGKLFHVIPRARNPKTGLPLTYEEMIVRDDAMQAFEGVRSGTIAKRKRAEVEGQADLYAPLPLRRVPTPAEYTGHTNGAHVAPEFVGHPTEDPVEETTEETTTPVEAPALIPELRAYFIGASLLSPFRAYQGEKENAVVINSGANKLYREKLLKMFKFWCKPHETKTNMQLALPTEFAFLTDPGAAMEETADLFDNPNLFGPFLLGIMNARLSDKGNHVTSASETLLQSMRDRAFEHFDIDLGQPHPALKDGKRSYFLHVKDPEKMVKALRETKGVQAIALFGLI